MGNQVLDPISNAGGAVATGRWLGRVTASGLLATVAFVPLSGCSDDAAGPPERLVPIETLLIEPITVSRNPSGIAPLSAEATIRTTEATNVTVRVLGPEPAEYQLVQPDVDHLVPVLGLYPDRMNRVEVRIGSENGPYGLDTVLVHTRPLPEFFPEIQINVAESEQMEAGWSLSSFSIGDAGTFRSYPLMFDGNGAVRWYLDLSEFNDIVFTIERLQNGNLVFGSGSAVYEYDRLGRQMNRWDFPGYWFHHDVFEKPNGNLLVAVDKLELATVEDHVLEVDRVTGAIVREWDLREVLDVGRRTLFGSDEDWFHMNSVWSDQKDDTLILSGRNQGVVKVTADNELVWILAPHKGWERAGVDGTGHETATFLLTAVDDDGNPYPEAVQLGDEPTSRFDWPWGQHAAMVLPNGNVLLFDNGDHRNFTAGPPLFSRAVEYEIDEEHMTVRQIWEYGRERGSEFYSPIVSDVDYLHSTDNRLVMPGIVFDAAPRAYVTEVTNPEADVVFEAEISFKNLRSTADTGWGQFDLVYGSERMPIYRGTN